MNRTREHRTATLAAGALLIAALGGCATTSSGVGGESHFVGCKSDNDCASGDGACVAAVCKSRAALKKSDDSGVASGSGAGAMTSIDAGATLARVNLCVGMCCPADPSCYEFGNPGPGAECIARRDNTRQTRMQMQQTWVNPVAPVGFTQSPIYQNLSNHKPAGPCRTDRAGLDAFDFDLDRGVGRMGSTAVPADPQAQVHTGLCLGELAAPGWTDVAPTKPSPDMPGAFKDFSLPASQMSPSADYPPGLPAPMPQPWIVKPTTSIRLVADFDLSTDRIALLGKLSPTGDYGSQGYTGVFFWDSASGRVHTFSPVTYWNIPADDREFLPVREVEESWQLNDPDEPNCVGRYSVTNGQGCGDEGPDPTASPWIGLHNTTAGQGDAVERGYLLITELEQVWFTTMNQTFCNLAPTSSASIAAGWGTQADPSCRNSPNWNPSDPVNGLPQGDWCAATNSAATPSCHDAYRTVTYQALQAFPVRDGTCPIQ